MQEKLKLPIGMEDFQKLRTGDFYYVDKTMLISDLMQYRGDVNLFTRPRRFGKTLNMDMLRCFFEIGQDASLFDGLQISGQTDLCEKYRGKYPVISVSLKGAVGSSFAEAEQMMRTIIAKEFNRHAYASESKNLTDAMKQQFQQYMRQDFDSVPVGDSIRFLSDVLQSYHNAKVIILIDEYDVPLDKAYQYGYYDEMVTLIRNLLGQALKTNHSLFFGVLTGCLRISKESIFTGLNNLKVFSVADVQFSQYFGFTESEVHKMLEYYGKSDHCEETRTWYDGYQFGLTEVYNPWDVLNHCFELITNPYAQPRAYWINTSGNDIVRSLITKAKATTKGEIERLIAGESIRKKLNLELTYRELEDSVENIWSVLYTTGYLTKNGIPDGDWFNLVIPNEGIRKIFKDQIYEWFREYAGQDTSLLDRFCLAFRNGDAAEAEKLFTDYLKRVISIRDNNAPTAKKENFYHGILLGLFSHMEDWYVRSNVESGDGYSDILIEIPEEEIGIVIEVKFGEDADMETGCRNALAQIERLHYEDTLLDDGMTAVLKYGISCYKKKCRIQKA